MGVKVVQAGDQGTPLRIDHHRAARAANAWSDLGNNSIADQDIAIEGGRAGGIEDARVADQSRPVLLGAGRQARERDGKRGEQGDDSADHRAGSSLRSKKSPVLSSASSQLS